MEFLVVQNKPWLGDDAAGEHGLLNRATVH
jgi:hypothetical protein